MGEADERILTRSQRIEHRTVSACCDLLRLLASCWVWNSPKMLGTSCGCLGCCA